MYEFFRKKHLKLEQKYQGYEKNIIPKNVLNVTFEFHLSNRPLL